MEKLHMISGDFGPFEPMEQATVPLWLAIILKKNNKCRIVMPTWLSVNNLRIALEKDRTMDLNNDPVLYSLPNHYIEISRILLENCEDDIEDAKEVRSLLDIIIKVRESRLNEFKSTVIGYLSSTLEEKFNHGEYREFVKRPFYDIIEGASDIEVNRLFSQFLPVLEELTKNEDTRKLLLSTM
ncbi:hypothetical protein WA556_002791, partial [Blastocystis sp. ATCC 50177/Nand II]